MLFVGNVAKKVDDTAMQTGAEAYAAARTVYTLTKTPFAKAPMRQASQDLAERFRKKKAKATTTGQPASGAPTSTAPAPTPTAPAPTPTAPAPAPAVPAPNVTVHS